MKPPSGVRRSSYEMLYHFGEGGMGNANDGAALKHQGRYLAMMRGLPAAKRVKVKRIRATNGTRAAIAAARRMGR